ncbi:MAG: hypothetical protein ACM37W_10560 [Actinomycetota bacterium]
MGLNSAGSVELKRTVELMAQSLAEALFKSLLQGQEQVAGTYGWQQS